MISQYDVQKLTDLILENRDALNSLHTATTEQKMQAAYEFANTDRELFTFVELLAARDEHTTAADANGWIEWGGGKRPVGCNEPIEIRFRNGEEHRAPPVHHYEWRHLNTWSDIIAYRVVS